MLIKKLDKVCAVMVTYNSDEGVCSSIPSVIDQVDELVIVDNGSNFESLAIIRKVCENSDKVKIIELSENMGIAFALNRGIEYSIKMSYNWVLTLDQDSICTKDMIKNMLNTYDDLSNDLKEQIYVITPYHVEEKNFNVSLYENIPNLWNYKLTEITSGTLAKIEVYKKILYNEELFIDLVDHDFCLSINELNMKLIQVNCAILKHNLGESTSENILGINTTTTNHSPLRRYYMTRNRLFVWRKFWNKHPKWVLYDVRCSIVEAIKILFFESDKKEKFCMMYLGIKDYRHKKMGKYFACK